MRRRLKPLTLALAAAMPTVFILAACGSSSSAGNGSAAGAKAEILVGGTASVTSPIFNVPELKSGLEASISAVNAAGGIHGHMLKLDFCDNLFTANGELGCARSLVAAHVSAVLDPLIIIDSSGAENKVLQAANTAAVGSQAAVLPDLASPISFPLASGLPGWVYGAAQNLIASGATKLAVITDPNSSSEYAATLFTDAVNLAGLKVVRVVADNDSADPTLQTAVAKTISGGVNGVMSFVTPTDLPKAVTALKQAGYTGKIAGLSSIFSPAIIKTLGPAGNGILLTSQLEFLSDTSNPGVKQFIADMNKYQPHALQDEVSENAWAAVQLFAKAEANQTAFSPSEVLNAFRQLSVPVNLSLTAPYFVKGRTSPVSAYPRILNPTVYNGVLVNGVIVSDGQGAINPFALLKSHK